jgi:uncharacterized membrane protein YhiD involved in acid resistance
MDFQATRQRIFDSAIEFALDAFWFALWSIVATAIATVWGLRTGAPLWLVAGLAGAFVAFLVVVIATASIVAIRHRKNKVHPKVGRKGFMDYKIQAIRALSRLNRALGGLTDQMARIERQAEIDSRRLNKAVGSDERDTRLRYRRQIESKRMLRL